MKKTLDGIHAGAGLDLYGDNVRPLLDQVVDFGAAAPRFPVPAV